MKIRGMKPEDFSAVRQIISVCFNFPLNETDEEARISIQNDKSMLGRNYYNRLVAENENGTITSTIRVVPYTASFDGGEAKVADIGAVATLPEFRNQGAIRECFKTACEKLYEKDFAFAYVQAFSTSYYKKFGCAPAADLLVLETKIKKLATPEMKGSYELITNDADGLKAVYEEMRLRYSFLAARCELDWLPYVDGSLRNENKFTYLYRDENGTPKSFFTFEKSDIEGEKFIDFKERVYFYDKEGFLAILAFASKHEENFSSLKMAFSVDAKVESLIPEHCRLATTKTYRSNGMARCIKLKSALASARFIGSGRLVLEINDEMIKENCGRFAIEFENGKLTEFYKTSEAPTAKMNIEIFAALIIGKYSSCDFEFIDGLEICADSHELEKIFYKKRLAAFHC